MILKDKPPVSDNLIKKRIDRIVTEQCGYEQTVADVISNLYSYMRSKKLRGGCHALSSALYVALSELNQKPVLWIGECQLEGKKPFDHSWISINNQVIDLAIYVPLTEMINSVSGPVIFGIDAVTMKPSMVTYGLNTGLPLDLDTDHVVRTPFFEYMSNFPMQRGGLWSVVQQILPSQNQTSAEILVKKYADVRRNLCEVTPNE